MSAKNCLKFPSALLAQRELELVFAVATEISDEVLAVIRATFKAGGEYLSSYAAKLAPMVNTAPIWWKAMRKWVKALAKAVKMAIEQIF